MFGIAPEEIMMKFIRHSGSITQYNTKQRKEAKKEKRENELKHDKPLN